MALNPLLIEAIAEVIAPSKENSPLKSPSILRRETRIGVSKFWLEYVTELVDSVLQKQIQRISEHRVQSDKFYDRLVKKETLHEYTDLDPKTLLRILGSYVRKSQLKDKDDDHTRLSVIEVYEFEKLYEFIKTEDGRQLLHEGIVDVMDIKSELLSPGDIEKLKTLQFSSFREEVSELDETIKKAAEFTDSVAKSWNYVDEYVWYIRGILIWYYQQEAELATKSVDGCRELMTRKWYSSSYNKWQELLSCITIFTHSQQSAYARFHELSREASADILNKPKKVTIVVRK